jgi:hypothetical protein
MITSLVIASPEGAKQSHKRRLRLPRRSAPRNDISYEIAALPSVDRKDYLNHITFGMS